ncbi:MAG: AAA family ATPase [Sporolactobacillus sp.]
MVNDLFIRGFDIRRDMPSYAAAYWDTLPAIRQISRFVFDAPVTCFVGENGSGKSTLIEALAVSAGFNAEGGSRNFSFSTQETHAALYRFIRLIRGGNRPRDGFFLRAESFYNVASYVDQIADDCFLQGYGGRSLHAQSHGESFLSLILSRFGGQGLYILDEPEAALSPQRQMTLLVRINELVQSGSQLIIATHSPIIMAYPHAALYELSGSGIVRTTFDKLEHVAVMRRFLEDPQRMIHYLFD